jgi:MerR family copper efflux transcriptional regulator
VTTGLQIRHVAEQSGFSVATLRYYEQIGIVPPPARTVAGYRVYEPSVLSRLAFVGRAKQLGCTLEEIAELGRAWDGGECGPVQDRLHTLVTGKIAEAQDRVVELMAFVAELRRAEASLGGRRTDGPCGDDCGCVTADAPDARRATTTSGQPVVLGRRAAPSTSGSAAAGVVDSGPAADGDGPPIACSLTAAEVPERLADWQALLAHVVERESVEGGTRALFAPTVPVDELMRSVTAEQVCCSFFRFTITVDARGTALEVRAPQDAADLIDAVLGRAS